MIRRRIESSQEALVHSSQGFIYVVLIGHCAIIQPILYFGLSLRQGDRYKAWFDCKEVLLVVAHAALDSGARTGA